MKGKTYMNSKWILNTGASYHMTNEPSLLKTFSSSSQSVVWIADDTPTLVIGEGFVVLFDIMTLDSMLVVPSSAYNLLFVS